MALQSTLSLRVNPNLRGNKAEKVRWENNYADGVSKRPRLSENFTNYETATAEQWQGLLGEFDVHVHEIGNKNYVVGESEARSVFLKHFDQIGVQYKSFDISRYLDIYCIKDRAKWIERHKLSKNHLSLQQEAKSADDDSIKQHIIKSLQHVFVKNSISLKGRKDILNTFDNLFPDMNVPKFSDFYDRERKGGFSQI
jgi:hypothetical protein